MKNMLIALVFGFLLAGCATEAKYNEMLDTWMGSQESELISKWGVPSSVYETDGTKYLTYRYSSTGYVPGTPPSYQTNIIGNTVYTNRVGGTSGMVYQSSCDTTFTVKSGKIVHWSWQGNACRLQ